MKINVNTYRKAVTPVLDGVIGRYIRDNMPLVAQDIITIVSVATGAHIIAVAYLYKERYPESEGLEDMIARLKKFYKVTEIGV